ncbi:hypothetical protein OG21DRAFT_1181373 [Imleria badia]|nr:hypothetical protein OG21DRAFT_1181373 [Imleria badia]
MPIRTTDDEKDLCFLPSASILHPYNVSMITQSTLAPPTILRSSGKATAPFPRRIPSYYRLDENDRPYPPLLSNPPLSQITRAANLSKASVVSRASPRASWVREVGNLTVQPTNIKDQYDVARGGDGPFLGSSMLGLPPFTTASSSIQSSVECGCKAFLDK